MSGRHEQRIPPKRLRLVGVLCGSVFSLVVFLLMTFGGVMNLVHGQGLIGIPLLLVLLVTIPFFVVFALWALVRLMLNLPAVVLTPTGVINNTCVYHVVVPWDEIKEFVFLPSTRGQHVIGGTASIVILKRDDRRIRAMQQPLTRFLMRVFSTLSPTSINPTVVAGSREALWERLQAYVRENVPNKEIKFSRLRG